MKTLKTVFTLTLILFIVFSCKNDDDDDSSNVNDTEQNQSNILGNWKFTSSTTNGVEDTDNYICDFEETLEFTSTTATDKFYYDPSEENGPNCELEETLIFNYSINGNQITQTFDNGNSFTVEIVELSGTTFKFKNVESSDTETFTYITTYTKI